jgi:hypothetical protein
MRPPNFLSNGSTISAGGAPLLDVGPLAPVERQRHVLAPSPHALLAEPGQVHGAILRDPT